MIDDIWAAGRNIRYRYYVAAAKINGSGGGVAFGIFGVADGGVEESHQKQFVQVTILSDWIQVFGEI